MTKPKQDAVVAEAEAEDQGIDFGQGSDSESMVVDLSQVTDAKYEAIPRGMYPCEIDALEFTYSQNSGNPMWTWTLRVDGGEYDGRKLFLHTVFAGAGLPRTKTTIGRVMPELLEGPFDPSKIAEEGTMIGRKVKARVDIRKYEGENRNNVRDVFPADTDQAFLG